MIGGELDRYKRAPLILETNIGEGERRRLLPLRTHIYFFGWPGQRLWRNLRRAPLRKLQFANLQLPDKQALMDGPESRDHWQSPS